VGKDTRLKGRILAPLAPITTPGLPVWMMMVIRCGWRMISTSEISAPRVSGEFSIMSRNARSSCSVVAYSRGSTYHFDFQVRLIPSLMPIGFIF